MSDWEDYAKEPTAAGASYTRSNEQIKKLKEENDQLQLQESARYGVPSFDCALFS